MPKYFEMDRPDHDGLCSDNDCPCNDVVIPHGTGYLYVSPQVVQMRHDARTIAELGAKIQRMGQAQGKYLLMDPACYNGILCCEQAARRRHLDLKVAAEDARYWWEHGLVPLRATPNARSSASGLQRFLSILNPSRPLSDVDDKTLFERLVSAMSDERGKSFVKAIGESFKLCEEGAILGLCAMEEAMRRRSGNRDLRFYWLGKKARTREGLKGAQELFASLAKAHMLLADPACSGDLICYLTAFVEDKTEFRKHTISVLVDSYGIDQSFAFQLLDHHSLAQARLRGFLGDEAFLELAVEQTLFLTGHPNRPTYVSDVDALRLPPSLMDKLFP